jgi:ferredoxin
MYKLKLSAKDCISCGICMDVCLPKAIAMRIHKGKTIEGVYLSCLELNGAKKKESVFEQMMTFPFMANVDNCDGCMDCVKECPTNAIEILYDSEAKIQLIY